MHSKLGNFIQCIGLLRCFRPDALILVLEWMYSSGKIHSRKFWANDNFSAFQRVSFREGNGFLAVVLSLGSQHTRMNAAGFLGVFVILGFCHPLRLFPESMKFDDS